MNFLVLTTRAPLRCALRIPNIHELSMTSITPARHTTW